MQRPPRSDEGAPERRREPRTEKSLPVRYRTVGESVVDPTRDISGGGLFLDAERPLPLGTKLELFIDDDDVTLRFEAEVVRVVWGGRKGGEKIRAGMAVKFVGVDDDTQEKLNALLDELPR